MSQTGYHAGHSAAIPRGISGAIWHDDGHLHLSRTAGELQRPPSGELGVSGYMIPFALLLTVSGTIGERFGRRRVIRATFITYALASVLCVFAPTLTVFVVGRLLQGAANAFITPLLIAGLSEVINPSRLGRAVGVYTGFQARWGSGTICRWRRCFQWRIAFAVIAVVGLVLATQPPHGEPRPAAAAPPIKPP